METVLSFALPLLSGVLLGAGALWMKNPFFLLAKRSVGLLNVLVADIDEDEKFEAVNERVMGTVGTLLKVLGMALVVVLLSVVIYTGAFDLFAFTPLSYGMVLLAIGSIVPFLIPSKKTSDYSAIAQLFHHLIMDNYHLGKKLLNYQVKHVPNVLPKEDRVRSVLITGLARAGTTALTKELDKRGPFASLDYSNMPVLMAPRLWAKFYKPKRTEDKERAHGDGVKVGLASVEALEEYFFKVLKDDSYIQKDGVYEHAISVEDNALYRRYQKSIAGDRVYLAKNNNAITRIKSLQALNPDTAIFIMFRDPLEHANSLMRQHQKFVEQQEQDPFVLNYMNWLGHHEFGKGQRPFILGGKGAQDGDPNTLDYWLSRWINYYQYALTLENPCFLNYEDFLTDPKRILSVIKAQTGLSITLDGITLFDKKMSTISGANEQLRHDAYQIYEALNSACLNESYS